MKNNWEKKRKRACERKRERGMLVRIRRKKRKKNAKYSRQANVCIYRPDRAHCTAFQCMASADTVHAFRSSVHDDYSGIGIPASVNRASSSSTLSSR